MFSFFQKQKPPHPHPAQDTTPRLIELGSDTMGTTYQVRIATARQLDEAELATQIHAAVDRVDQQMSTWKPASDLSRFNAAAVDAWVPVPADLALVVRTGLAISRATQGAFDMTVGAAVNAWGFGPEGPVTAPPQTHPPGAWQQLKVRDDPPALCKMAPMYVDLSGIAKGYGVDQICAVLHDWELGDHLVSIDGETRVSGHKPGSEGRWRVAVDTPADGPQDVWDVLEPADCAVATSGDYRRFFDHSGQRFAHTIDPATGQPVTEAAASVTVIMPTCIEADAWATALLVLGPKKGIAVAQARNMRALFLFRDGAKFREVATGGILD